MVSFTFFSICVWEDDGNDEPTTLSKCDEFVCCVLRKFDCFINACCANVDDNGCPMVAQFFPPPIEPSRDDELEGSEVGAVETPPLLFTRKKHDGVEDDELTVCAKCRYDMMLRNKKLNEFLLFYLSSTNINKQCTEQRLLLRKLNIHVCIQLKTIKKKKQKRSIVDIFVFLFSFFFYE